MSTTYAPPVEPTLRDNLDAVVKAYTAAMPTKESALARSITGDGEIFSRIRNKEGSFRVATYDDLMGHLSFLWPSGLDWPEGVPRPEPKQFVKPERKTRKTTEAANGEET